MRTEARAVYERFRAYPGSDWIAKPEAISGVIEHIARARPRTILEVGAGIGTVTYAIVSTLKRLGHDAHVVTIEHDPFCLESLAQHLPAELSCVDLLPSAVGLAPGTFDFVIVDGGTVERGGYAELLAPGGTVLVEGGRAPQRDAMREVGRPFIVARVGSVFWDGGWYWLMKFEPTMKDRAAFAAVSLWDNYLIHARRRVRQVLHLVARLLASVATPNAQRRT